MRYSLTIKGKKIVSKGNFVIFIVRKNVQAWYIIDKSFSHAVQIYKYRQKPHFKQDAFSLICLKSFSTVHRSIHSAIKNVNANSEGINSKGLYSSC